MSSLIAGKPQPDDEAPMSRGAFRVARRVTRVLLLITVVAIGWGNDQQSCMRTAHTRMTDRLARERTADLADIRASDESRHGLHATAAADHRYAAYLRKIARTSDARPTCTTWVPPT